MASDRVENTMCPREDLLESMDTCENTEENDNKLEEKDRKVAAENRCAKLRSFLRVDRTLIPIKSLYLSFYGGLGCVLPYLAVFLKQCGLSPQQIGLISGIRPVIGFISGPVWGILGDKYNIRRGLLLFSITTWLAFYVGFYHIPIPARVNTCPTQTHRSVSTNHLVKRILNKHSEDNTTTNLTSAGNMSHFTPSELSILRENLGWLYVPSGVHLVFILAFVNIVGGEFVQAPALALTDVGALQTLGPKGLDNFGPQRAWASVGWAISSFAVGAMVSTSRNLEYICGLELYFSDYRLLAYVFIGFMVLAFISATLLKFKDNNDPEQIELTAETNASEKKTVANDGPSTIAVFKLFHNVHYGSWLATCFYAGVCNGVIWGFLFWHLENLGADQLLMGVDSLVVCVIEVISCFHVIKVIRCIGHMGIMYAGLVCYIVRFITYAVITNPWLVLPADILQGISFSCVWVSMTSYTAISVPEESLATVQGILHGVYFGLGNGVGHLIGGLLIGYFGAVITFFSMAVMTLLVLLMFFVAQKCSKKPEPLDFNYKEMEKQPEQ